MNQLSEQVQLAIYEKAAKASLSYNGGQWNTGTIDGVKYLYPETNDEYVILIGSDEFKLSPTNFGMFCTASAYISLSCNPKYLVLRDKAEVLKKVLLPIIDFNTVKLV